MLNLKLMVQDCFILKLVPQEIANNLIKPQPFAKCVLFHSIAKTIQFTLFIN